jgi:hypothetical protein
MSDGDNPFKYTPGPRQAKPWPDRALRDHGVGQAVCKPDPVADPQHYKAGEYECRAVQKALARTLWSGSEHVHELCNALKYTWRACSKGKFNEDVRKAAYELLSCVGEDWRMRVNQTEWQQYLASKAGKVESK